MRKITMNTFLVVFYVLFFYTILAGKTGTLTADGVPFFFLQFLFICGFLLSFHLAVVDLKKYKRAWIESAFLVSLLLQLLYVLLGPFGEEIYAAYKIFIVLALSFFHVGIIVLISEKRSMFRARRFFSSWGIVTSGVADFSIFIALTFAVLAAGAWKTLPVSCAEMYDSIGDFAQWLASPVLLGVEKASLLADQVDTLSTATVGEIIGIDDEQAEMLSGYLQEQSSQFPSISSSGGNDLVDKLERIKLFVIEEAADKSQINQGICEVIVDQINTKAKTSGFRYSVATLLFFLFFPLVRFFFFLVSLVSVVFFKLLQRSRLYEWKKIMKEVEEIE